MVKPRGRWWGADVEGIAADSNTADAAIPNAAVIHLKTSTVDGTEP